MAIEAITFDLWGTVLWPRDPDGKIERRMELLLDVVCGAGAQCTVETLEDAWKLAFAEADEQIKQDLVDMGPPGRWKILAIRLGLDPGKLPYESVEAIYQELTMEYPPPPMPGIGEVLRDLAGRYRIGLISNTGVTGGNVLRRVLDHHGLLACFDATVFSNEYGRVKPDPSIFHHTLDLLGGVSPERALHVGDLEELDVDGARASGMAAFRYRHAELQPDTVESLADQVFSEWQKFPSLLAELECGAITASRS